MTILLNRCWNKLLSVMLYIMPLGFAVFSVFCVFKSIGPQWTLFSSSTSPDGKYVIENWAVTNQDGPGQLVLRRSGFPIRYTADLSEPASDLFFRWRDNVDLVVFSNDCGGKKTGPDSIGPIAISWRLVSTCINDRSFSDQRIIQPWGITADTDTSSVFPPGRESAPRRNCALNLVVEDGQVFDHVNLSIHANLGSCGPASGTSCGEIDSEFKVGSRADRTTGHVLTSATVAGIRSYNQLPDGAGYAAIRGRFSGEAATKLIDALKGERVEVRYELDFTGKYIVYQFDAKTIAGAREKFLSCLGDVDFE